MSAEPSLPPVWSEDALAVCARLSGHPAFPTVDPAVLDALGDGERAAVQDAVGRSLLARGLLVLGDAGVALHPAVAGLLAPALAPDTGVVVDRRDAAGRSAWSVWRSTERTLLVATAGPAGRRVEPTESSAIGVDAVLSQVALAPTRLDDVDAAEVTTVVDLHSCWRDGVALVGCLLRVVASDDGRVARAVRFGLGRARLDARIGPMSYAGPAAYRLRVAAAAERSMLDQTR